jgi:translation initiation factor 2B subunit (eIF-2B alpha/beta/delta family)
VLSKATLRRIEAFRADNRSGASSLTRRAIEILTDYLEKGGLKTKEEFLHDLRELCGRLIFAQPSMYSIRNLCIQTLSALTELRNGNSPERIGSELKKRLSRISLRWKSAHVGIAAHLVRLVPRKASILTLSHSSTVVKVLARLKRRGKEIHATVLESRPLFEGRITARELLARNIPVTLIADAAVGMFARKNDLAVVGADTIFSDGSVLNKIGTFPLALCCKEAGIPFYVVADSSKLSPEIPKNDSLEEKSPSEILQTSRGGLKAKNYYFEITPSRYIKGIITEGGILRFTLRSHTIPRGE